ncbi:MAG TPA: hypothetical protein VNE61_03780, partial [Ktedonobacteraceae bacterium]|nr:hypothetical protein [Ktedonobacteraceae bacterium]
RLAKEGKKRHGTPRTMPLLACTYLHFFFIGNTGCCCICGIDFAAFRLEAVPLLSPVFHA